MLIPNAWKSSFGAFRAPGVLIALMLLASCASDPASAPSASSVPVASRTATVSAAPSATPRPTPSPTPAQPPQPAPGRYLVVVDTAFIREGPGLAFAIAEGGYAQLAYNTLVDFDAIVRGDLVNGSRWWGHMVSGVGFVALTATQSLSTNSQIRTAPAQSAPGRYRVVLDTVLIREGPGLAFLAAEGGNARAAYNTVIELDAIVPGDPVDGNPWWGHLASGVGFVAMSGIGLPAVGALDTTPVDLLLTPELPTLELPTPELPTSELPALEQPTPEQPTPEQPTPEQPTPVPHTPKPRTPKPRTPVPPTPVPPTPVPPTPCSVFSCRNGDLPDIDLGAGDPNDPTFVPCEFHRTNPWLDRSVRQEIELGLRRYFFACDFPTNPVSATMTLSDGTRQPVAVLSAAPDPDLPQGNAQAFIEWAALPMQPTGTYTLTVDDSAGNQSYIEFSVSPPTGEYILPIPVSGPPGTTFQIYYVNFLLNTKPTFDFYAQNLPQRDGTYFLSHRARWQIAITQPLGSTSERGWAQAPLESLATDDLGAYAISHDQQRVYILFWLR